MVNRLIIKKPIITEKSLLDAGRGIFAFEVDQKAEKKEIKKAVEALFKVHVLRLSTINRKGKKRLVGRRRMTVKESDMKRVRVKLKAGEKIDLFEVGKST